MFTTEAGQRYQLLGIEIADPSLIYSTTRVVKACAVYGVFLTLRIISTLLIERPLIMVLIELGIFMTVPIIGYQGAKKGSSSLMGSFVCFLILLTSGCCVNLIMLMYIWIYELPELEEQAALASQHVPYVVLVFLVVQAIALVGQIITGVWAAYNANRLLQKLMRGEAIAEQEARSGIDGKYSGQHDVFDSQLDAISDGEGDDIEAPPARPSTKASDHKQYFGKAPVVANSLPSSRSDPSSRIPISMHSSAISTAARNIEMPVLPSFKE